MSMIIVNKSYRSGASVQAGFTLLELMIVVAIVAILAAIAIPSYIKYVTKTNRAAAEGCLSEYANYMERYYTTNLSYASAPASSGTAAATPNSAIGQPSQLILDCAATAQTGNNYKYDVTMPASSSSVGYYLMAEPKGTQATRDTQCGSLTLDQAGNRNIVNGTGTVTQCWGG